MTTLRDALSYEPTPLAFGTSGLRGLVTDITSLEAFIDTLGFLEDALASGDVRPGEEIWIAGDLRPSTDRLVPEQGGRGEILQAVSAAITAAGLVPAHAGRIPSPALMLRAVRAGRPSVMVTGSHIPFDRNGIKFNKSTGEVLKSDEARILASVARVRAREYARPASESLFDARGMLKPEHRQPLPPLRPEAREAYVRRYVDAFPAGALRGSRIVVYQHSAVGRDVLVEILTALGADVVPLGRSESFIPVDTEAVDAVMLSEIQGLVDEAGGHVDAVVSTDGDSDRPLLVGVEAGRVRFFGGDVLGLVTADFLGARELTVPVSVSDVVDLHFAPRGIRPVRTAIGSPFVIAAMREVGWEANGGFLTARPVRVPGGGELAALPTRDAVLPLLAALSASVGRGRSLSSMFDALPPRFSRSVVLRRFPREKSLAMLKALAPSDPTVRELFLEGATLHATRATTEPATDTDRLEFKAICARLAEYFRASDGFDAPVRINWVDGMRITFACGDVAHVRASGNAPELRLYAVADTPARADQLAALGVADDGILRRMERGL